MPNNVITKSGALIQLSATDVGQYIRIVDTEHVRIRILEFNPQIGDEITIEHVCYKSVVFDVCIGASIKYLDRFYPEILGMFGVVSLKCVAANEWVLFGALIPKPQWQTTVDEGLGLNYQLFPVVDVDWTAALTELEAAIGSLEAPTSATITCNVIDII
jgi:hypothetical protein